MLFRSMSQNQSSRRSSSREPRGQSQSQTPTAGSSVAAAASATPSSSLSGSANGELWKYFIRSGSSGRTTAKCTVCDTSFKVDGDSTIGLAVHLRNAHRILLKRTADDGGEEMAAVASTPVGVSKHSVNGVGSGSGLSPVGRILFEIGRAHV